MTLILLKIGLVLTPFFFMPGIDVRDIKLTAASTIAVLISLSGLKDGIARGVKNPWFYYFLAYSLCCWIVAPNPKLTMMGIDVGKFWVWQPMYNFLLFGLLIIVISGLRIEYLDIVRILKVSVWVGLAMSIYVILQYFNVDQFFDNVGTDAIGKLSGTIGNPTHVSPFIGMLVPIALYLRKYTFSIIMVIAVCMTTSQVAIGAMTIGVVAFYSLRHKNVLLSILLALTVSLSLFSIAVNRDTELYKKTRDFVSDNQRFATYMQVIKDVNSKPFKEEDKRYPLTGWGMGNFKYTFHFAHFKDETWQRFHQAHNDYLELLYNTGIIGFLLFMVGLFVFYKDKLTKFYYGKLSGLERSLLSSFIVVCVTACGTFIWQIGSTVLYSAIFFGLINNKGVELCEN